MMNSSNQEGATPDGGGGASSSNAIGKRLLSAVGTLAVITYAVSVLATNSEARHRRLLQLVNPNSDGGGTCAINVEFAYDGYEDIDFRCLEAPTSFEMLYIGGDCNSNTAGSVESIEDFTCTDYNGGPPSLSTTAGQSSTVFMSVTNEMGFPLFEGTVQGGDVFTLYNGGQALGDQATMEIYTDPSRQTPLQTVVFDSTCANQDVNLLILGSSQIMGFTNPMQGDVDAVFEPPIPTITLTLTVPDGGDSYSMILLRGVVDGTNDGFDVSSTLAGKVVSPNNPVQVTFEAAIWDSDTAYQTIVLGIAESTTSDGGGQCSFEASDIMVHDFSKR